MRAALVLVLLAACHDDAPAPPPQPPPPPPKVVPAGPYKVSYECSHSNEPFGKGGQVSNQTLDLGAKTRTTLAYTYDGDPAGPTPFVPPPPAVSQLSDPLVAMMNDAVIKVLSGGPYTPELPPSEGTPCLLTITNASGAQLFRIEKADHAQKDAVSELVRAFAP